MAKHGTGNERAVAERIVRRECEKEGLDYDDVMAGRIEMRPNDDMPFSSYGFRTTYTYTGNGNFYKQYQENTDEQRRQTAQQADDLMEHFRRKKAEADAIRKTQQADFQDMMKAAMKFYNSPKERTIKDRVGMEWTIKEIMNLTKERRIMLFGRDPLSM